MTDRSDERQTPVTHPVLVGVLGVWLVSITFLYLYQFLPIVTRLVRSVGAP